MKHQHPTAGLRGHRRLATAAVAVLLATGVYAGAAAPSAEADSAAADITDILLTPGATTFERTISWSGSTDGVQGVQYAPSSALSGGEFPASAVTVPGDVALNAFAPSAGQASPTPEVANGHVVLSGLAADTEYSYRVGSEGHWSPTYTFATGTASDDYEFLVFGDPQIGSSGDRVRDGDGWVHTLDVASDLDPDAELYISAGDQVESAGNDREYDQFFRPEQMRSTPMAMTIGNHDVGSKLYEQHFEMPNTDTADEYYANGSAGSNTSGGNYWFTYKDTLFIDINSNSYTVSGNGTGSGNAAHINYVSDIIDEHGDDARWTVLVYHHSIYSPADHANDADNARRRADLPRAFSRLGVDLVLQGHDHSYSRSYLLDRGQKADAAEQPGAGDVFAGPGGVLYLTATSSSGSKYYDLTEPIAGSYGPDPLDAGDADGDGHVRHFANSVESQEHVPGYLRVGVTGHALSVASVRSGDCDGSTPNAAVERSTVGGKWCGTEENTLSLVNGTWTADKNPNGGVGTLVDEVTLHRVMTGPESASISGTPKVGARLTASVSGEWEKGTVASYVWKAGGVAFGGNLATQVLGAAQLGKTITVDVVGEHERYETVTVSAPATSAVVAGTLAKATPRVSGAAKVGKTLTAVPGTWTAGTSFGYQWLANGKALGGKTAKTLKLTAALQGKKIAVRVTGRLAGYTAATTTSAATGKVARKR